MGRPTHTRALSVWMNGQRVGTWRFNRRGEHAFQYDDVWMKSDAARPLSLSLPLAEGQALRGDRVQNYFDNLLPDSEVIRQRLASRFRTQSEGAIQ